MIKNHQMNTTYLNAGCGRRFYNGKPWINIDVGSDDETILPWDVRAGLPMEANAVDVVYLSHVLEHFSEEAGVCLTSECHRVLRPGGVLRVVVPDLEGICREYLRQLDEIRSAHSEHPDRLAWIKLELLDQCVRHKSGGRMREFFSEHGRDAIEIDYVVGRIGTVGLQLANADFRQKTKEKARVHWRPRFCKWNLAAIREWALNILLTEGEEEALRIGKFRTSGEVHLWMYESVSLVRLLQGVGFDEISLHNAETSQIADWECYQLDRDSDGREHAPNSLYIEAKKKPA